MFDRRRKRRMHEHVGEIVWPTIGWRRAVSYMRHRVGRLPGSPYSIASGFAFGAAVSFTPFMGFHILTAGILSWICRGNVIAAAIGTAVGNPWTFPLIWTWIYMLGAAILGAEPLDLEFETLAFAVVVDRFWELFVPMAVGGAPTAVLAWFVFFYPVRALVRRYQAARFARREQGRARAISAALAERAKRVSDAVRPQTSDRGAEADR